MIPSRKWTGNGQEQRVGHPLPSCSPAGPYTMRPKVLLKRHVHFGWRLSDRRIIGSFALVWWASGVGDRSGESIRVCLSTQVADIERLNMYLNRRGVIYHYNHG